MIKNPVLKQYYITQVDQNPLAFELGLDLCKIKVQSSSGIQNNTSDDIFLNSD